MAEASEARSSTVDKPGEEQLAYLGIDPKQLSGRVLELGSGKSERLKQTPGLPKDCEIISLSRNIFVGIDPYINTLRNKKDWDRKTVQADALALPFKNNSFKYVLSVDAIPHFIVGDEQIKKALSEIYRVLDTNGQAILFPVNEKDLGRAQDILEGQRGYAEIQNVDKTMLKKYGYFDKTAKRLVIKKF